MSLSEYFANEAQRKQIVESIISDLTAKKSSMLEFITQLDPYVTSTEDPIRLLALRLMHQILGSIPLSSTEADVFKAFYLQKLDDHYCIEVVLESLVLLVAMKETREEVLNHLIRELDVKLYTQAIRKQAYSVILSCMKDSEYRTLIPNIIVAIEDERDPRNLALTFCIMNEIIETYPDSECMEELIETVFAYFPIEYKPLVAIGGAVQGVSPQALKETFHAIICTPQASKYVLPLMIEKFSTDRRAEKVELIELYVRCVKCYSNSCIINSSFSFLQLVIQEVCFKKDSQMLNNLIELLIVLSHYSYYSEIVQNVMTFIYSIDVSEVDLFMWRSKIVKVLAGIKIQDAKVLDLILQASMDVFVSNRTCRFLLADLVEFYFVSFDRNRSLPSDCLILNEKSRIFTLLLELIADVEKDEFKYAFRGCVFMSLIPNLLDKSEVTLLFEWIWKFMNEKSNLVISEALSLISKHDPSLFSLHLLSYIKACMDVRTLSYLELASHSSPILYCLVEKLIEICDFDFIHSLVQQEFCFKEQMNQEILVRLADKLPSDQRAFEIYSYLIAKDGGKSDDFLWSLLESASICLKSAIYNSSSLALSSRLPMADFHLLASDAECPPFVSLACGSFMNKRSDVSIDLLADIKNKNTILYVIKGQLMKLNTSFFQYFIQFYHENESIDFSIMMESRKSFLSPLMNCYESPCYKQFILAKFLELNEDDSKYVKTLMSFLQNVSKELIDLYRAKIDEYLIKALHSSDPLVAEASLQVLCGYGIEGSVELIDLLLKWCHCGTLNGRISACKMLSSLAQKEKWEKLLIKKVIKELLKCLDDHKKLVRLEAGKCRNKWFLLLE